MATRNVRPPTIEAFHATSFQWDVKEKSGQTFLTGAVVVLAAGYALEGAADPALGTILGIAEGPGQNGTNDGDKTTTFGVFLPGTIIEANLCAGASANTKALAQTDVGTKYGIIKRTVTGETHWVIDSSETTVTPVRVVGLRDDVGDINGRVYACVLATAPVFGT